MILATLVLLILPITDNFIFTTKSFTLIFSALIVLILFVIKSIQKRAFEISLTPFTIPLLVFGGAVLASTFFTNAYPVEGLLGMGGAYLSFVIISLFTPHVLSRKHAGTALVAFSSIIAVLIFASALELSSASPSALLNSVFGINLPNSLLFNLSGSGMIALQLSILALTGLVVRAVTTKKLAKSSAVLLPLLVIGVALFGWSILPGNPANSPTPSFASSWSIMLDTLHNPRAALIGVGPASYSNAYLQFKPAWINTTDTWAAVFVQGANTPFSIVATLGLIGLSAWLWMVSQVVKRVKSASQEAAPYYWMLGVSILLQLILPPNVVFVGVQAVLFALLIAVERNRFPVLQVKALETHLISAAKSEAPTAKSLPVSAIIGGTLSLILIAGMFYLSGRAYAAHYYMGQAERAGSQNDAVGVYQNQMQAVTLNPYLDSFRRNWANTNMMIAAALSNKTDATEAEKEQASQLIQQVIREARSSTLLDPNDSQNWEVLAQIYSNLIGSVEEADQWATQSYVQAIERSPNNPALRVALGGLFATQKNYSQAASLFQQATQIKADYPNAHYNLGVALKELGQYEQAKSSFEVVLTLIPADTEDYKTVEKEVEELSALIAEQQENNPTESVFGGPQTGTTSVSGNNPSLVDQSLEQAGTINPPPSDGQVNFENN